MPEASPIFFQRDPATGAVVFEFTGRKLQGGQSIATFVGGGSEGDLMTIPHGLGPLVPKAVVCGPVEPIVPPFTVDAPYTFQTSNYTAASFDVRAISTGGGIAAGTNVPFTWIAITDDSVVAIGSAPLPKTLAAKVIRTTDQAISLSTTTSLIFDTAQYDNDAMWDPAAPTRLTCRTAGLFWLHASHEWAPNGGFRTVQFNLNGAMLTNRELPSLAGGDNTTVEINLPYLLSAGDYIEVRVWQNAANPLNILAGSGVDRRSKLSLTRIGSYV